MNYIPELQQNNAVTTSSITLTLEEYEESMRDKINHLILKQKSFMAKLKMRDPDVFYSRTDLRMCLDNCKRTIFKELLDYYFHNQTLNAQEYEDDSTKERRDKCVIHAAVKLKIHLDNLQQILKDYSSVDFVQTRDFLNFGVLPLHIVASVNDEEDSAAAAAARVECILSSYKLGAKYLDSRGRLPLHCALLHGAGVEVVVQLVEAHPISLTLPFMPTELESSDEMRRMVGFLPFHMSCCLDHVSCSVIFELLQSNPSCICTCDEKNC